MFIVFVLTRTHTIKFSENNYICQTIKKNTMIWVIIILIITLILLTNVLVTKPKLQSKNITADDIRYDGPINYGWRNNWLIDRKMNKDWKIQLDADPSKPYMGSSLHDFYS